MRDTIRIFILALCIAGAFWVADSVYMYYLFDSEFHFMLHWEPLTFYDALIFNVPNHSMFSRQIFLFFCMLTAMVMSYFAFRLKRSNRRYRDLFNSSIDAIFIYNSSGEILDANTSATQMLKVSRLELLNSSIFDFIAPEFVERTKKDLKTVFEKGQVRFSITFKNSDGEEIDVEISANLFDEKNNQTVLAMVRDVTAKKALEEQVRQTQKMDAIGQLAGGVAHDFNNMLTGIIGATELLEQRSSPNEKTKKFFKIIKDASERAGKLTEKLLTFSRKQPSAFKVIDVNKTLFDAISILESTVNKLIIIETELNVKDSIVNGDFSQLQSAFLNLCINASHAMPDGGTIFISTEKKKLDAEYCDASGFDIKEGEYLQVEIRDTGCGISQKDISRIFEPFFTTKPQGKGTGLGLSAAFGTIQQHKGLITVSSVVGIGTSFYVLLPLVLEKDASEPNTAISQPINGTGRILLVDDEETIRITASGILESLGYEVVLAKDGAEGLAIFKENADIIDLVILDMIMPKMNGRLCFDEIKKFRPETKIILASGFTEGEDFEQMKKNGLSAFIKKPYSTIELSQVLANTLSL